MKIRPVPPIQRLKGPEYYSKDTNRSGLSQQEPAEASGARKTSASADAEETATNTFKKARKKVTFHPSVLDTEKLHSSQGLSKDLSQHRSHGLAQLLSQALSQGTCELPQSVPGTVSPPSGPQESMAPQPLSDSEMVMLQRVKRKLFVQPGGSALGTTPESQSDSSHTELESQSDMPHTELESETSLTKPEPQPETLETLTVPEPQSQMSDTEPEPTSETSHSDLKSPPETSHTEQESQL